MPANVEWLAEAAHTYEIESYDPSTSTWTSIITGQATSPYEDVAGTPSTYYHVRDDTGVPSPWTPSFLGLAVNPTTCNVVGYVYTSDGAPMQSAVVHFKPLTDQKVQSLRYSVLSQVETETDVNGLFEQEIVRGLVVYVKIPDRDFQELITIPNQISVNIDDLV